MRGWKLDRPPGWGIVTLVALVVVNVALFTLMALSPEPADSYGESRLAGAADSAPTPGATPGGGDGVPSTESAASPVLAVYGDGYAAGNESGGLGVAGWPAIVAERTNADLRLHAVSQAGYAAVGSTGQDFAALVEAFPVPDADVTVIFGSRNDLGQSAAAVQRNAAEVIATVQAESPETSIVVVGPVWDDADVPQGLLAVRDAVQAAALAAGVTFVDPLDAGWFAQGNGLIAPDGVSPNDQGHVYLADRVTPLVESALADSADPTA
ncbi:SGNH/GDSL hydrolase family protein [Blastococcus sp. SYSU DS1021]